MESKIQTLTGDEEKTLPFIMDHLPEKYQEKALVELKETPENRIEGLLELKLMAKANRSTSGIDFHDDFLLQFLRHSKYNIRKSFKRLQLFVELRRNSSFLFQSVDPVDLVTKECYKSVTVLPRRCPDGCTIVVTHMGKFNPPEISFDDFRRLIVIMCLQPLRDTMTQINGFKFIYDFKGTSFKHLKFCTPHNIAFGFHAAMECFPGRYKRFHFVNQSIVLKAMWTIVRPMLSSKIRNRMLFHSHTSELLSFFPRSVVPVEYGGDMKDYYMANYIKEANKMYGECTVEGQANYF